MEFSYYSDSLHSYLVVPMMPVSPGIPMGYQYRMLAVNRIEGLLEAGIRNIDGAMYLYYDITSRQSLSDLCRDRMLPPELIRKLLFTIAAAGRTLSYYLLDDARLLLGPDFIYYDFEREDFFFTYYPEPVPGMGYMELFQFLSGHVDPQEKRAAYVIYHLCELAGNQHFILKEDFLDREYGKDRRKKSVLWEPETIHEDLPKESEYSVMEDKEVLLDQQRVQEQPGLADGNEEENKPGNPLVRILIIAILLLFSAIGLEVLQAYIKLPARQQVLARSGVMMCLALAIVTALYGTLKGYLTSRRELKEEEARIEEEKKNEMKDTLEYDRPFVV